MAVGRGTPRRGLEVGLKARLAIAVLLGAIVAPVAPLGSQSTAYAAGGYHATIRRTSHGIPHILANDFAGVGFGYGYAFAQDNLCVIADQYVTVDAQRSRYFGPDGQWVFGGNSAVQNNLNSDFFFQQVIDSHVIEDLIAKPPPEGPVQGARDGIRGYVAGYNKFINDTGVANLPDPACRGASWVHPIAEIDAYRRFYELALLASSGVAIDGIGSAQPPIPPHAVPDGAPGAQSSDAQGGANPTQAQLDDLKTRWDAMHEIGSNAYGLGRDATDNGHGMVLGNPHFPWEGSERLYQAQLTIPGQVNVEGGSLFGVPIVLIGHTDHLAWSHTVSTAFRFTPYELKLVPGDDTSYIYDGQVRHMTARTMTVQVKQPDGSLQPQSRTLYSSHFGPMLTSILGLPIFPWTTSLAYTLRDANAANFRYINHFFEVNQAQTVGQLYDIQRNVLGIPWVNTLAADDNGDAYYSDISNIPNVPNSKVQTCVDNPVWQAVYQNVIALPVMDGSMSTCEWNIDADSPQPGTFGPNHLPHLFRTDFTANSNDSYWLSNPGQPLTGFARIIGDEATQRALRTRLGIRQIQQRLDGSDGRPGNRFTLQQLQDTVFGDRQYTGELTRDALVTMCQNLPGGLAPTTSGPPVSVSGACSALANWDLHDNLNSNGALLFRRWYEHAKAALPSPAPSPSIWSTPFSAADPVNTPRDLNTSLPTVRTALGDAINDLNGSGDTLNAPLQGHQYKVKNGEQIPIHGGPGTDGVFNAINDHWSASVGGYPDVPHGSSFVMAAHFNGTTCPDVRTIVTYSQSTNSASPYYADQTKMFSNKQWVTEPYCENQIAADPNLTITVIDQQDPVASAGGPSAGAVANTLPNTSSIAPLAPRLVSLRLLASVLLTPALLVAGLYLLGFGGRRLRNRGP